MPSNLLGRDATTIITALLAEGSDVLYVVNPNGRFIEQLIDGAVEYDDSLPEIRVVAEARTLKDVMDDFLVASNAADLVDRGALALRTAEALPPTSLLVTEDSVVALVSLGESLAGLTTDDPAFVESAVDAYGTEWEHADAFSLRTPAISRVRTTLTESLGPDVETDFENVLGSLETARGDGEGLDEVTVSLLVAAKNRVLLYDVSKWGEDVGIASKATFSRTKTRLEDLGLLDTEKVPIDVGRPRLRLKLSDRRLQEADPAELASVAQSVLAAS